MDISDDGNEIAIHAPSFSVDNHFKVPPPLPSQASFCVFCSRPGGGKTSLTTALLTQTTPRLYSGQFDHVYLFVPAASFASMVDSPFKNHDPEKVFHEFNQETLGKVVARLDETRRRGETSLCIIDDMMSELKTTGVGGALRKDFERLIANRRHLRASCWVLTQIWKSLPPTTRRMTTDLFMWRPSNMHELEAIREEVVQRDKAEFMRIYNFVFHPGADKHTFMLIKTETGELFNRWAKIHVGPRVEN